MDLDNEAPTHGQDRVSRGQNDSNQGHDTDNLSDRVIRFLGQQAGGTDEDVVLSPCGVPKKRRPVSRPDSVSTLYTVETMETERQRTRTSRTNA